jgi:hypothetical protein
VLGASWWKIVKPLVQDAPAPAGNAGADAPGDALVARLAHFETAGTGPAVVDELARLVAGLDGAEAGVAAWARALLAERAALRFDPRAVPLALDALAGLPAGPVLDPVLLMARGRLHRLVAWLGLLVPGGDVAVAAAHHAAAVDDFDRCELDRQTAFTMLAWSGLYLLTVGDDPLDHLARMEEAQALLVARGSRLRLDGGLGVAVGAGLLGDHELLAASLDRVGELLAEPDFTGSRWWAGPTVQVLRAVGDLIRDPGDAGNRARLETVAPVVRGSDSWIAALAWHTGAVAHANLGDLDGARRWVARAAAYPAPFVPVADPAGLLPLRLRILGGDTTAVAAVKEVLNTLAASGRGRLAAQHALRVAVDCRRADDLASADLLAAFGLEHLGPPAGWSPVEASVAARAARPSEGGTGPAGGPTVEVRLLAPRVLVAVDGDEINLAPNLARLLAVLLVTPPPLTADRLVDVLWPDADLAAGRRRLASALHRLRAAVGAGRDGLVVRHGEALTLVLPDEWRVDLFDLRAARRGGDDTALAAALGSVTGVLASAQFAFDEALADARHALVAEWLDAARSLCRRRVLAPADLAGALGALELEPADLL